MTDWELLRQYREEKSNEAFRKLADRHMQLVYSTCRRELGNTQAAEDATQLVFILLARKANGIMKRSSISSWLFGASRFVCKDMVKSELRRQRREEAAARMEHPTNGSAEWDRIEPSLNDALTSLNESDREAVLMRYYDGMSLGEIARQIGTTEDTARKRVSRAVERLRGYFQREQAAAGLIPLDSLLAAYAAHTVPAHTQASLMSTLQNLGTVSAPATALHAHAGLLLKKGVFALMDATVKKVLIGLAVAAVIGVAVGIPVTASHIHNERLLTTDSVTLVDASGPSTQLAAAGPDQAADRSAIVGTVRQCMEEFRRRNISNWVNNMTSDAAIDVPGQPAMTATQYVQQQSQVFQEVGPFRMTATVQSLRIQGNSANLILALHFVGTPAHHGTFPAGVQLTEDETQREIWAKEGGRWLTKEIDVLSSQVSENGRIVYRMPEPPQAAASPQ